MSLLNTSSLLSITTRMKLPWPAWISSYRETVTEALREAAVMAGRSVAWDTSLATFSTSRSTRWTFSSMALLMDLVSSTLRR